LYQQERTQQITFNPKSGITLKTINMNTFSYYQHIKKSAVKTLVSTGINVRDAFTMVRNQMPYLFVGVARCKQIDKDNQ